MKHQKRTPSVHRTHVILKETVSILRLRLTVDCKVMIKLRMKKGFGFLLMQIELGQQMFLAPFASVFNRFKNF
jgi:hypothetical protein